MKNKDKMLGRFKSALMNAVGASELGLHYSNDSDNESVTDLINSNLPIAVETKPYSRPSFLGLTNEETQVKFISLVVFINYDQILHFPIYAGECGP